MKLRTKIHKAIKLWLYLFNLLIVSVPHLKCQRQESLNKLHLDHSRPCTEVCRISATRALTYNSLLWAMLSVMSFEVGTSYSAQSVPYMEGNALCCCKESANLCTTNGLIHCSYVTVPSVLVAENLCMHLPKNCPWMMRHFPELVKS